VLLPPCQALVESGHLEDPTVSDPQFKSNEAIDFDGIDLGKIDLELGGATTKDKPKKTPTNRVVTLFFLLSGIAAVMWLPTTHLYKASNYSTALFFGVCLFGIGLTFAGGRFLWAWMEEAAQQWALDAKPATQRPPRVVQPIERWLTLLAAIGLGSVTLFAFPESSSHYDGSWMLKALGGACSATLGGRWLFIQAGRAAPSGKRRIRRLPAWFKWLNLALLLIGGLVVLLSELLFNSQQSQGYLSALGFILGIGGAIWLARRFDELETRFRKEASRGSSKPLVPHSTREDP
jgi:uncharacterized membrane protein YeaQ/YmgE (transglycosylase-associated protein family)